jgi:N-acetylneuraminic acid mutarotase
MKGDFSRFTFRPTRRYSGVLMQQGRVQLDADWNEQIAILAQRDKTLFADMVGASGSPAEERGFQCTVRAALDFSINGQVAEIKEGEAFGFEHRAPFTIEAWVCPIESGKGATGQTRTAGSVFSRMPPPAKEKPHQGYRLAIEEDAAVCFYRGEIEYFEDREKTPPVGGQIGEIEVTVLETVEMGRSQRILRSVRTWRKLPLNQFSHVAVTFDGRALRIYVNGELWAQDQTTHRMAHVKAPVWIGAYPTEKGIASFRGSISDLRIWDVERTGEQIRADLYARPKAIKSGLVAWYEFLETQEEKTAGHVIDSSSGGHTAARRGPHGGSPPAWSRQLWIERGRYYVEGLLVENDRDVRFDCQPDYPGLQLPEASDDPAHYLLFLDAHERLITALEDPELREVALGGPDTTVRTRTVWRAGLLKLDQHDLHHESGNDFPSWRRLRARYAERATMRASRHERTGTFDNQLYRIEIHNSGFCPHSRDSDSIAHADLLPDSRTEWKVSAWPGDGEAWVAGDVVEILTEPSSTALLTRVDPERQTLELDPKPAAQLISLQLRRLPSFKWSRENGSVVFPIETFNSGSRVQIVATPGDEWEIAEDHWVEVGNDDTAFSNPPRPLSRIVKIDYANRTVTLPEGALEGLSSDTGKHPYLRRWDQHGHRHSEKVLASGVIPIRPKTPIRIEKGIEVEFPGGGYCFAGDYWTIPARSNTEDIEWPGRDALLPSGIDHAFAALALLRIDADGVSLVRSYRQTFLPLTRVTSDESQSVRKTGEQSMTGPLRIDKDLHVGGKIRAEGEVQLPGRVEVGLLSGSLAPGIVGAEQIEDGSVTEQKLAFPIEGIPEGSLLILRSPDHVPGFHYWSRFLVMDPEPRWHETSTPPELLHARAVSAAGKIFALTHEGELWEFRVNGSWRQLSSLQVGRSGAALAAVHHHLFAIGGIGRDGKVSGAVSRYDTRVQQWRELSPMRTPRSAVAVAVVGKTIYAMGGTTGSFFSHGSRVNEAYDHVRDEWKNCPRMPTRRVRFGLAECEGKLYAIGGNRKVFWGLLGSAATGLNEEYDPTIDQWLRRSPMPEPRGGIALGKLDDKLFALGGESKRFFGLRGRSSTRDFQRYEPKVDIWVEERALDVPRAGASAVTIGNTLYAVGGVRAAIRHRLVWPVASVFYLFGKGSEWEE